MIQSQNQSQPTSQQPDCRSEATSVCGDNSSVLSGFSGAIVGPQGVPGPPGSNVTSTTSISASKAASNIANQVDSLSKRDSLVAKESANIYVDASSNLGPQSASKMAVNDDLETSTPTAVTGKEW